tara:strand:+ start:31 stop:408 length:378 start_codon:yes stop_codon:yes gene_type:complete
MSDDIKHHIITYRNVFIALLFLTGVTVGASYIEFGSVALGLFVGLLIASIKGFLVAANFMHLDNEKSFIYGTLIVTIVFFFVLLTIPLSWDINGHDVKTERNNPFDEYKVVKEKSHDHDHHEDSH